MDNVSFSKIICQRNFGNEFVFTHSKDCLYTRQIKFSNFRNIIQSLHIMNKSHILEMGLSGNL